MTQPGGRSVGRYGLTLPWWSLAYAILTTAGLALLAWGIVVMQALGYGVAYILDTGPTVRPDADRYSLAFAVAVAVNLGGAVALSRLWLRTRPTTLPPAMAAVPVAVVSGGVAAFAMLAVLGIEPTVLVDLL